MRWLVWAYLGLLGLVGPVSHDGLGFARFPQSVHWKMFFMNFIGILFGDDFHFLGPTWTRFGSYLVVIVFSEYLQLFAYYFLGYCFSSQICTWGDSVPNESLKRSIPVWCDFHGDSDMVPWRHPFSGRMWTDLTTELTHFNLVIRLRKAKQLAFSFISLVCNILQTLLSQCLLENFHFYLSSAVQNNQKLLFSLQR